MLDILLLILLLGGLIVGAKRGLVVQLIHMVGFIIALVVAYLYYKPLAEYFVLWIPYPAVSEGSRFTIAIEQLDLDQTFYQLFAFALIFFAVKFALQILASMFDFLKYLPLLGFISKILGAILGLIEVYILLFIFIYVLALLPMDFIQNHLAGSGIAQTMLEHTPYFSEKVKEWWYIYM
ncbi:putative membrane protein required for colicin V production [Planomicrobium soli]|uniref:Putative membrane protein required for colicin V production n=1 Tax=Planomicrobium soli TaxID=1176648 RepID=A0A2P8GMK8_9BACL|nr:CvpA family protein [Planomicrobium soli]PSL35200.1 putative membrane protein required for colicin V production [Planomicrobium soli]